MLITELAGRFGVFLAAPVLLKIIFIVAVAGGLSLIAVVSTKKEIAWGVFNALSKMGVVFFVVVPMVPERIMGGFIDLHAVLMVIVVILGVELGLFLFARLVGTDNLMLMGLMAGVVSSSTVTFNLAKGDGGASSVKMVFAAKTSAFFRNLIILAAILPAVAADLWVLIVAQALFFFGSSLFIRGGEKVEIKQSSSFSILVLVGLFIAIMTFANFALENFGEAGLFVSIFISAGAGVLPQIFTTTALLGLGKIGMGTATILIGIAFVVASFNDIVIALVLRAKNFAVELFKREVFIAAASVAIYFGGIREYLLRFR